MGETDTDMLNSVYQEIGEQLGMDTAKEIYRMFKGQQICFPMRFFSSAQIRRCILAEYDGTNIKQLAVKYSYSEKTVRRIIKEKQQE